MTPELSVCPPLAAAIVSANCADMAAHRGQQGLEVVHGFTEDRGEHQVFALCSTHRIEWEGSPVGIPLGSQPAVCSGGCEYGCDEEGCLP